MNKNLKSLIIKIPTISKLRKHICVLYKYTVGIYNSNFDHLSNFNNTVNDSVHLASCLGEFFCGIRH